MARHALHLRELVHTRLPVDIINHLYILNGYTKLRTRSRGTAHQAIRQIPPLFCLHLKNLSGGLAPRVACAMKEIVVKNLHLFWSSQICIRPEIQEICLFLALGTRQRSGRAMSGGLASKGYRSTTRTCSNPQSFQNWCKSSFRAGTVERLRIF